VKRFLRKSWRFLTLAIGLSILGYLVARLGVGTIVQELEKIGPSFFLMPSLSIFGLGVRGLSILPLMERDARFGWIAAISSRLAATALNIIVPVFGVAGEPARLLWLEPGKREAGIPAIILDRALLILADLAFLILAVIAALTSLALPRMLEGIALASAAAAVVVALVIIWITARRGVSVPAVKILHALGFTSMKTKLADAKAVDDTLRALWRDRPRCVLYALAIQFVSRIFLAGEIWVGLWLLQVPATPLKAFVVSAAPIAANAIFTFIPNQFGVQEGGMGLVFGALRMGARTGMVLGVIQRMSQLVQIPIGLAALATAPRNGVRRQLRSI
jgi:hypothetical protein